MEKILKLYQFMGKYKGRMAVFLGVATISVILETVRPFWLKNILDNAGVGNMDRVWLYLGLFGTSTIGANIVSALSYYLGDRVLIPLSKEIREAVFNKVMVLDFAYHVNKNTGSLISAFRRGDGAVFTIFESLHQELFRVLVALIVTLIFLFRVSTPIALALLVLFFLNLGIIWWLIKNNLVYRKEFNKEEDEI